MIRSKDVVKHSGKETGKEEEKESLKERSEADGELMGDVAERESVTSNTHCPPINFSSEPSNFLFPTVRPKLNH